MVAINALIPRQRLFDGVPTSVPFTYRDGLTTLQLIECLRHNLDALQSDFNALVESVNTAIDANNQDIKNMADNLLRQMATLREELIRLIEQSQVTGLAWSPVYGEQDALQTVLDGMYDNARNHGLFWGDYDNMQLEASMYDALGLSAREYDLRATAVDNCVPGDFPGRSQFPYGKSIPEGEPADVYLTQDSADAKYVQRNPTASLNRLMTHGQHGTLSYK
nr:MAG TPA_asm: hypothetical protein [Caudoviricetes sp.]